jgi:hypothetical protein
VAQPIKRFLWWPEAQGRDLHVVPESKTRDLRPDLLVQFADNGTDRVKDFLTATPGATLTFRPLYNGILTGSKYEHIGAALSWSVDVDTGVVQVGTGTPSLPVSTSFLIEAHLAVPGRVEPYIQAIRVQVHPAVKQVWLTPPTLVVPIGSTPPTASPLPRFTVRAEFTDGIVGDVTLHHGVTWAPGRVDAVGGLHVLGTDSAGDEIAIAATVPKVLGEVTSPPGLGAMTTAPATMRVAKAWTFTPPVATLVVGGAVPSAAVPPEASPNVLFMSDGFTDAQRPVFDAYVDLIVDRLRRSRLTRPYDLLAGTINFWRVFLPSPVSGVSCRDEVSTTSADGRTIATPLPAGRRPLDSDPWTRRHLAYAVGYPVASNDDGSKTVQELRGRWKAALPVSWSNKAGDTNVATSWSGKVADPTIVSDAVIAEWQALAQRSVIDEIDGGFSSVSMGVPPAASLNAEALLEVHPERGGRDALNDFFFALQADDGTTLQDGRGIGHLWRRPEDPAFAFDNTKLIVVVSSYPGGRPLNTSRTIVLSSNRQTDALLVTAVPGRNSFTLSLLLTPGLSPEVPHVVAHELAHSFGLGDEYQEFEGRHPQLLDSDLDRFGNLQFESVIRAGNGRLQTGLIKWNWHRIRKAVVVTGPITAEAGGTRFRVPVRPIDSLAFEPGERVLLRQRKPRETLGSQPLIALSASQEAEVVGPPGAGSLLLKAASGSSLAFLHLAPFTPGSLVYQPTEAPASAKSPTYPYAEMIAKNVRDYMDSSDRPLTAVPCKFNDDSIVAPILPGVTLRSDFCRLCTPVIVGLYSGGARFSCGVFHPSGHCVMASGVGAEFKSFCPVCRYLLVDFISPQFHGAIDDDYEDIYPQP